MPSGRRVRLVGKAMVINLNNKGGVRKAKSTTSFNTCIAQELVGKKGGGKAAQRQRFTAAAKKCSGRKA